MPEGTDAVAPADAIIAAPHGTEAISPRASGEGVIAAGSELPRDHVLRRRGEPLREIDLAIGALAGIGRVAVRLPRIALLGHGPDDPMLRYFAGAIVRAGAAAEIVTGGLEPIASGESDTASFDAVVCFGGTGTGSRDVAVSRLAAHGRLLAHGIAIEPGSTAAFGQIAMASRELPVLCLPGAFDAAFAGWLLIGAKIIATLAAAPPRPDAVTMPLARKIASPPGLTGIALIVRRDGEAWPVTGPQFALADLGRAGGWVRIEADREGHPQGTSVAVMPMP
jgi:molybdopterin molybdotransferase